MRINKLSIVFVLLMTFVWAEPKQSFNTMSEISNAQLKLNNSIRYSLLYNKFPNKDYFAKRSKQSTNDYLTELPKLAKLIGNTSGSRLLNTLLLAKDQLGNLQKSPRNESFANIFKTSDKIDIECENIYKKKFNALSPEQHIVFSMHNMMSYISKFALLYLETDASSKVSKTSSKSASRIINIIDSEMKYLLEYKYWNEHEKKIIHKINSGWNNLKSLYPKSGLYIVFNIGADHLSRLLKELIDYHDSKVQG